LQLIYERAESAESLRTDKGVDKNGKAKDKSSRGTHFLGGLRKSDGAGEGTRGSLTQRTRCKKEIDNHSSRKAKDIGIKDVGVCSRGKSAGYVAPQIGWPVCRQSSTAAVDLRALEQQKSDRPRHCARIRPTRASIRTRLFSILGKGESVRRTNFWKREARPYGATIAALRRWYARPRNYFDGA